MSQNLRIMNLRIQSVLFGALATLVATTGLRADTIVYNSFGPGMTITSMGDTGAYTIGPPGTAEFFGAPFSPSATVDLTSLTGSWAAGLNAADETFPLTHPAPITVSIWSGSSSGPTTELESWALTVDQTATNYTLTSTTNPELITGDTYWVVAGYTGADAGENFMGWGVNTATTSLGLWGSETSATSLDFSTTDSPALEVQGTPSAVPEPTTFLLTGMGFLSVLMRSRWRRSPVR